MAFEKKQVAVAEKSAWAKKAPTKKPTWNKKAAPAKREPFKREYVRDVKFANGDITTYVWVFSEYKHPTAEAPQFRLMEEKFVMEGRDRLPVMKCPVAWEVEMHVRIEAYVDFEAHYQTLKVK